MWYAGRESRTGSLYDNDTGRKGLFFLPFINGEIDHLSRPIALKEIEFVTK